MKNEFNSYFFNEFQKQNGGGNYMDAQIWLPFFEKVAQKIVDLFNPSSVLDAGCACGYLVGALRDLGVDAYGFDISKYAIGNVRENIKEYCFEHSITEPLPNIYPQTYDLVVTSEVLEHLFPEDGEKAIANLCKYSDTVVFSSSPCDIQDRSHVNVQLPEYWAEMFYNHSFAKNFILDMSVLSPWCVVYEKFTDLKKLVFNYELNMRIDKIVNEQNITETINDLMESLLNVTSKVYFADESGEFQDSLEIPQKLDDAHICVNVTIPENTKKVKFAPVEGQYCLLKNLEIYLDNQQVIDFQTNGDIVNHYVLFTNITPEIVIENLTDKRQLKIVGKFQHVEDEFLQLYLSKNMVSEDKIQKLSHQVQLVESTLVEMRGSAGEHAEQLGAKDAALAEREGIIAEQTTTIAEKNATIAKKEALIAEKEEMLEQKDIAVLEKMNLLSNKETALAEKTAEYEKLEEELKAKDEELADKVNLLNEKTAELEEKESELASKDVELLEKETALVQKDSLILQKDADLQAKESTLLEKNKALQEKETAFMNLDEEVVNKNIRMNDLSNELKKMQMDLQVANQQNASLTEEVTQLQASFEAIQSSSVWKMTAPLYRGIDTPEEKSEGAKGKKDTKDSKDKKGKKDAKEKDGKESKDKGKKEKSDKKDKSDKSDKGNKEKPDKGKKDKSDKGKKDVKGKKDTKGKKSKKDVDDEEGMEETVSEVKTTTPPAATKPATATPPVAAATPPVAAATPPVATATPPVAAAIPPVAAATPPVAVATPPVVAATPPVAAATPPVAAATPPVATTATPPVATTATPPVATTATPPATTS